MADNISTGILSGLYEKAYNPALPISQAMRFSHLLR